MSPNNQKTHFDDKDGSFLTVTSSQTFHHYSHPATKQFYFTATFLATQWKLPKSKWHFNSVGSSFQLRMRGILSYNADELVAHFREILPLTLITLYARIMASTRYIG
jgi:hypothetical protein